MVVTRPQMDKYLAFETRGFMVVEEGAVFP